MRRPLFLAPAYWKLGFSPKRFFKELFATAGFLWFFIELLSFFAPHLTSSLRSYWWAFFLIGLGVALIRAKPLLEASYMLKGRDIIFEITVGDIWALEGEVVVTATTTFDTDGGIISKDSLQGQFTQRFFSSPDHLAYDINKKLTSIQGREIDRGDKTYTEYPVGTVVHVNTKDRSAYLLGLTHLNEYGNATASIEDLRVGLPRLWAFISERGNLSNLLIPIIGGGRARIPVSRNLLIKEIIISAIAAASSARFCEKLTVVVSPKDFTSLRVDLREIADFIRLNCQFTQYRFDGAERAGTGLDSRPI